MALKFVVFYGSVRENRLGITVAKYVEQLLKQKGHNVDLFDPLEMKFPLITKAPFEYREFTEQPKWLQEARKKVQNADGYVVVSAEYNYTIPPGLTNLMDHFAPSDYNMKPCSIATYSIGSFGGMMAGGHLRTFLGGLGMLTVPTICTIPTLMDNFKDGKPANERIQGNVDKTLGELEFLTHAVKNHNQQVGSKV